MSKSMVDDKWDVDTNFIDKEDLQQAIIIYVVHFGINIRWVKNNKKRVRVKCMGHKENVTGLHMLHIFLYTKHGS